jgi:hypothetical protein
MCHDTHICQDGIVFFVNKYWQVPSMSSFNSFHCPTITTIFPCFMQRNYRYFFLFITTSTFLCIFVFIFACLSVYSQMVDNGGSIWMALRKEAYSFELIIYTSIMVWFVGGLTVFHLYLISTNQVILLPFVVFF